MALPGRIREEEWTVYIKENSEVDRRGPSIFRVPNNLKKWSKEGEAYIPQRVSLGPYHHRSAEIPLMKSHKGRAVNRMGSRAIGPSTTDLDFFHRARAEIMLLEDQIRESYAERIGYDGKTLAMMLCFDGCFILEILRTMFGNLLDREYKTYMKNHYYYEPLFQLEKIGYTGFDILRDILKLENQIPLIVLRKLLVVETRTADNVENRHIMQQRCFQELVLPILEVFYPFKHEGDFDQRTWWQVDGDYHLLGMLHTLIVSLVSFNREDASVDEKDIDEIMNDVGSIPRAVELGNAGIQFRPCAGGIREINFDPNRATIYLPPILVGDSTETLFRNLLAFEMCKPSAINYVACYVVLMDRLIDCEEDVALLRKNGIVTNYLGSESQVAQLFNGLGRGVILSQRNVFGRLAHDVYVYRKTKWEVHWAELVNTHFSSAWSFIGLVAGFLILVASILQTVYTLLSYYHG